MVEDPVFQKAIDEIQSLGFRVFYKSTPNARPYAILNGRSNKRWWLIPLINRRLALSGIALFQPITTSAKILKIIFIALFPLGLMIFFRKRIVYISGSPSFMAKIFSKDNLHYSFFTGTDSPHRKIAVQIMDHEGNIKGFAKVSKNVAVKPLLKYEASILDQLEKQKLKSVEVPKVLFYGNVGSADVLITDSLKTEDTKTSTKLKKAHIDFIRELAKKKNVTKSANCSNFFPELWKRYEAIAGNLPVQWRRRFEKALKLLETSNIDLGSKGLSHGDFTPWNTFFVNGQLYVFDWEYASYNHPIGYDLVHFMFSLPQIKNKTTSKKIASVREMLSKYSIPGNEKTYDILILSYLCWNSIHYINRGINRDEVICNWDGSREIAACFDALL